MFVDLLLKEAGLSKQKLADNLGITVKAVYKWKDLPPKYAVAYLEQYIENRELKQGKEWMKRWLGE